MVRSRPVAVVKPFRALRYDTDKAGSLESLVAPPYDVISAEEREEYLARSPYNVVHLTLPEPEDAAGRLYRAWQGNGILVPEEERFWALTQDYVGPDGVARTRAGLVASLQVEPYAHGVVLPHERTHRGPKEGRLRLLRAVRAQLEPIFLLYDGPSIEVPEGEPDLEVEGARLWRSSEAPDFSDTQLLIADGHHRYETALAFHEEDGTPESGFLMVVLVSTRDPGLMIFPTHRIVEHLPDGRIDAAAAPLEALRSLESEPRDRPAVVLYRSGGASVQVGEEGLDSAFVEQFRPEGVTYTPRAEEAIAAVDSGAAEAAFLMRAPTVEQVAAVATAGETMPQKSTYFYPKLLSGLLFHPVG
jgi:uncharacterized protein (DUF1015 family)